MEPNMVSFHEFNYDILNFSWKMLQQMFSVKLGWSTSTQNWSNVCPHPESELIKESSSLLSMRKFQPNFPF